MKIAYIHRNDGTDMRVSKECNSLASAGHDVHFVGWRKQSDSNIADPMPEIRKHFNSRSPDSASKKAAFARYARHVWSTLSELKADVAHCVNEEHAAIALMHRKITGQPRRVVCDIFDSLGLRLSNARPPIPRMASSLSSWVQENSDRLIVTDERRFERLGRHREKAVIVQNYPVDPGAQVADIRPPESGPVRLLVAGTLKAGRGLHSISELMARDHEVAVVCAGWPYDDVAEEFIRHGKVDFRGVMTPMEALILAAGCDAIVSLYEPSSENNRLASPNKIFDALCVGRPVIINAETEVSSWVDEIDAGYVVRYGNIQDLIDVVIKIRSRRSDAILMRDRLRATFLQGYSWSEAEAVLLSEYGVAEV